MYVERAKASPVRQSTWCIMQGFGGAVWAGHYGATLVLGGSTGRYVRGQAAIHQREEKPFTQWRLRCFYRKQATSNNYMYWFLGDEGCTGTLAWNRANNASILYAGQATTILGCKTHGWYAMSDEVLYVYWQLKERSSGSHFNFYGALLEYE